MQQSRHATLTTGPNAATRSGPTPERPIRCGYFKVTRIEWDVQQKPHRLWARVGRRDVHDKQVHLPMFPVKEAGPSSTLQSSHNHIPLIPRWELPVVREGERESRQEPYLKEEKEFLEARTEC